MEIGNLKPFWMSQVFNGERLADFLCMREQLSEMSESAADFMDFELRYKTEFRYQFERAVDTMLLRGRGILKIVLDPRTGKVVARSIDPQFIIMAEQFDDFDDADWFVEIQTLTVAQYQRNQNFDQKGTTIAAIRGKADWQLAAQKLEKQTREGVTHSSREDMIILWNYYERTQSGWTHHTHCPLAWDVKIREPYQIPYSWDKEPLLPFYSLTMEIKDEGWYAPRGIAELNAAFEAYCTKLWNEKSDAMTFGNRPLFTNDGNEIANSGNIRFMPGELIPGNIKAVQMPPPAFSFAEEINFTRQVSEQRSKMPDYGISRGGESGQNGEGGKPRTATENNRIASLQDVGADHNGDIFRNVRLIKIYRHVWALIVHREDLAAKAGKPGKLSYYVADNLKTLPAQALHDQYLVLPAGGSGTRQQRLQRAVARYQLFIGKPNIDQDNLARDVIAADDARLVKKLLRPGNQRQQDEYLDQVIKINAGLADGFPVPVNASEDQATRIMACVDWLEKQGLTGAPVDPAALQRVREQIVQRFQMLQQQNPQAAKQLKMQIMQKEQQAAMQQPQLPPGNVEPMPQQQEQPEAAIA